jgi:hypothetical protein
LSAPDWEYFLGELESKHTFIETLCHSGKAPDSSAEEKPYIEDLRWTSSDGFDRRFDKTWFAHGVK